LVLILPQTSLHIGSLVPILLLVSFTARGHKPYALVGGATGMVGDPSGKSEERNLLSEETLLLNQAGVAQPVIEVPGFYAGQAPFGGDGEQLRLVQRFQLPQFYTRCGQTHYGELYDVERQR
jgi:tyrosyl-tRNA synthetase